MDSLVDVFVREIYTKRSFLLSHSDTVLDIGAQFGDTAIFYSYLYGAKVYAFER